MLKIRKTLTRGNVIFDDEKRTNPMKRVVWTSGPVGQYRIARTSDGNEFVLKCVGKSTRVEFPKSFDKEFKMILDYSMLFFCNVAIAVHEDGTSYLFDGDGNILLEKQKKLVILDSDLVLMEYEKGLHGLFNTWTRAKTLKKYDKFDICEEFILAYLDEKVGILDKRTLTEKLPPKYTNIDICQTYIKVYLNDKVGILDKRSFTEILPPIYLDVFPFGKDTFKGITSNNKEVIGNVHWTTPSIEVQTIYPESNGFYMVLAEKYGFIRKDNGQPLCNFIFDEARDFTEYGYAWVRIRPYQLKILNSKGELSSFSKTTKHTS